MVKFICALALVGLGLVGAVRPAAAAPEQCELLYMFGEGESVSTEIVKCGQLCFYRSVHSTIDLKIDCAALQADGGVWGNID